jgi:hypothetical protein
LRNQTQSVWLLTFHYFSLKFSFIKIKISFNSFKFEIIIKSRCCCRQILIQKLDVQINKRYREYIKKAKIDGDEVRKANSFFIFPQDIIFNYQQFFLFSHSFWNFTGKKIYLICVTRKSNEINWFSLFFSVFFFLDSI